MDLIYASETGVEHGFLLDFQLDVDIGNENDFEIILPDTFPIALGERFYCYGTEYGGILKSMQTDSNSDTAIYGGYTWRGMLDKKVIRPTSGQDYRIVSGNLATIINSLLKECGISALFVCDSTTVSISTYQFARYCTLLDGLDTMLKTLIKRLELKYKEDGKVHISVENITDHSEELEFSEDSNIQLMLKQDKAATNHLICLGSGELKNRTVVDLYVDKDGAVSTTQTQFGTDEVVEVYDYANAESRESLIADGTKKLQEQVRELAELNISDVDVALYDIVGARNYKNGTFIKREITQKIIRFTQDSETIEYKVGE